MKTSSPPLSLFFITIIMGPLTTQIKAATTVGFERITPSTILIEDPSFPLNTIADGITGTAGSLNGFVTNSVGSISFAFDQAYTLGSFLLWNDIVVANEGIDQFELRFFDAGDNLITIPFSASYTGPVGQVAVEEYTFPASVEGVARVDLEVMTTQFSSRIEIREVDFGVVPEPSATLLSLLSLSLLMRRRR